MVQSLLLVRTSMSRLQNLRVWPLGILVMAGALGFEVYAVRMRAHPHTFMQAIVVGTYGAEPIEKAGSMAIELIQTQRFVPSPTAFQDVTVDARSVGDRVLLVTATGVDENATRARLHSVTRDLVERHRTLLESTHTSPAKDVSPLVIPTRTLGEAKPVPTPGVHSVSPQALAIFIALLTAMTLRYAWRLATRGSAVAP